MYAHLQEIMSLPSVYLHIDFMIKTKPTHKKRFLHRATSGQTLHRVLLKEFLVIKHSCAYKNKKNVAFTKKKSNEYIKSYYSSLME